MLTVLLPTQNRPLFLQRAIEFYEREGLFYKIYVIDSSDSGNKAKVREIVESSSLNIKFFDFEFGISAYEKELESLNVVDSKYVLFAADDDFIFPQAIVQCVEFLDMHKDYTTAHGRSYLFAVENSGRHGRIKSVEVYPQANSVSECSQRRFKTHMRNWTTTAYSVQRTRNMKEIFATHRLFNNDIRLMEIHWYATNIIRGKVAKLNVDYMFRQASVLKEWSCDTIPDWFGKPGFSEKKDRLVKELSKELTIKNKRSPEYNYKMCSSEITRWIQDRQPLRPLTLKNILNHSIYYYSNKIKGKIKLLLNKKITVDSQIIKKIKAFVEQTESDYKAINVS